MPPGPRGRAGGEGALPRGRRTIGPAGSLGASGPPQDSGRLCRATTTALSGQGMSFHEGLRQESVGPRAGAALPLSPASALRSPVFISQVRLASHQEFRLNTFQVMEEGAGPEESAGGALA